MGSDWRELCAVLLTRVAADLEGAIADLPSAQLDARIPSSPNSIGWIAWHMTRSNDRNLSELAGAEQLWTAEGWHRRFDRPPDPADTGYGHSPEEARGFAAPGADVILSYHRSVLDMAHGYLREVRPETLREDSHSPTLGNTCAVQDRLVGALRDALAHVGQILLLRGALEQGDEARQDADPGSRSHVSES